MRVPKTSLGTEFVAHQSIISEEYKIFLKYIKEAIRDNKKAKNSVPNGCDY